MLFFLTDMFANRYLQLQTVFVFYVGYRMGIIASLSCFL